MDRVCIGYVFSYKLTWASSVGDLEETSDEDKSVCEDENIIEELHTSLFVDGKNSLEISTRDVYSEMSCDVASTEA